MKKTASIILTIIMFMLAIPVSAIEYGTEYQDIPTPQLQQKFSDVSKAHWAFEYIAEMANRGVISGYPDGTFLPENQVQRAEFAKIMVNAAGLRAVNNNVSSFIDVYTSDWYCPYVETAKDYLAGYMTNSGMIYKPETPALREDIAVTLVKLKGYDISLADESILAMFTDTYSISDSAKSYVAVAVERGLISGYEDKTFRGKSTISRAEAATLLWRAFQYGNDPAVDTSPEEVVESSSVPNTPVYDVDELGVLLDMRSVYLYDEGGLLYGKYDECENIKTEYEYGVKYGDLTILSSKASEGIVQISTTNPKAFQKNGVSLDKNEEDLTALLGNAEYGGPEQGIYYLTFLCEGYSLSVKFNDPKEAPYEVVIHINY